MCSNFNSLEKKLSSFNDYWKQYTALKNRLSNNELNYWQANAPEFTDHGKGHCTRVVQRLDQLLPASILGRYGLEALEQYCDDVTVFSKGHCTPWGNGRHYQLLCTFSTEDNDEQVKDSWDIWPATDQSKCDFVFLWHCGTADSYPLAPPYQDQYGYIGMPFCFSHNVAMTKYGDSGPCVFLGWDWWSPQFANKIPENTYWQYAQFAVGIFYYMHHYGWNLRYTLNHLSNSIYGVDFDLCPLHNDLIVWGNMDFSLYY
ncbi:MAG: hypothetical protein ACOC6G_01390 [Thermoproteota archaeon]